MRQPKAAGMAREFCVMALHIGITAGCRHGGGMGLRGRLYRRQHRLFQRDQGCHAKPAGRAGAHGGARCHRRARGPGRPEPRTTSSGAHGRAQGRSLWPLPRAGRDQRPSRERDGRYRGLHRGAQFRGRARERASTCATSDFTHRVSTANGFARIAPVTIDRISIGDIMVRDVSGAVMEPGKLGTTLLGMSFLSRLQRVDIRSGMLVLQE